MSPRSNEELRQILEQQANKILKSVGFMRAHWKKKRRSKRLALNAQFSAQRRRAAEQRRTPGEDYTIYVIGCAGHPVKIGMARDASKRLSDLQTGFPHKLRVYSQTPITRKLARQAEVACHERLSDYRLTGEWFDYDPYDAGELVREVVNEIAPTPPLP